MEFKEGDVVICVTSQAGTLAQITGKDVWIILRNGDIWTGPVHDVRFPQDQADLDACPVDVEREEAKRVVRSDS